MTNKLPSGEAIRAGAAQPLDLEPIKRHILIYDEGIENSSEISYAEWEDNNDIMAGEDVRSLVAEVERLRTHAPQNQTAVELQTEACPACGEICPKGWCGVCHIAILTDWQKGFQRICEVAAMNLARAEKAEAEVSRLRASSGSPSMPLCDLCREGQGLFKPEEGYDIGNGCVNCAYQNHIGILEEQLRAASRSLETETPKKDEPDAWGEQGGPSWGVGGGGSR